MAPFSDTQLALSFMNSTARGNIKAKRREACGRARRLPYSAVALRFGHFWGSTSRPLLSYSIMYRLTPLAGGPRENRGGHGAAEPD